MSLERQLMIKEKIKDCMRAKFQSYSPETRYMPFHYRLLGKDRMALYSSGISHNCSDHVKNECKCNF